MYTVVLWRDKGILSTEGQCNIDEFNTRFIKVSDRFPLGLQKPETCMNSPLSTHTHTHRCDVTRLESIFGKSSYWKNSSCRSVCVCVCVCKSAIVLCFNVPAKGLNSIKKRVLGVLPSLHSMAVAMVASLMVWRCLMV